MRTVKRISLHRKQPFLLINCYQEFCFGWCLLECTWHKLSSGKWELTTTWTKDKKLYINILDYKTQKVKPYRIYNRMSLFRCLRVLIYLLTSKKVEVSK